MKNTRPDGYLEGDLVHIKADLGEHKIAHSKDVDGIIIKCDGSQYGLYIEEQGESYWYDYSDLILIATNKQELLEEWKATAKELSEKVSDIDWIFENGPEIMSGSSVHGDILKTLGKCLGIDNLWGSSGEGIVYQQNAIGVFNVAKPFLIVKDKDGWLKECEKYTRSMNHE